MPAQANAVSHQRAAEEVTAAEEEQYQRSAPMSTPRTADMDLDIFLSNIQLAMADMRSDIRLLFKMIEMQREQGNETVYCNRRNPLVTQWAAGQVRDLVRKTADHTAAIQDLTTMLATIKTV